MGLDSLNSETSCILQRGNMWAAAVDGWAAIVAEPLCSVLFGFSLSFNHIDKESLIHVSVLAAQLIQASSEPTERPMHALFRTRITTGRHLGDISLQNVQIAAADRGVRHAHYGVGRILKFGSSDILQRLLSRAEINEGFHGRLPS